LFYPDVFFLDNEVSNFYFKKDKIVFFSFFVWEVSFLAVLG